MINNNKSFEVSFKPGEILQVTQKFNAKKFNVEGRDGRPDLGKLKYIKYIIIEPGEVLLLISTTDISMHGYNQESPFLDQKAKFIYKNSAIVSYFYDGRLMACLQKYIPNNKQQNKQV